MLKLALSYSCLFYLFVAGIHAQPRPRPDAPVRPYVDSGPSHPPALGLTDFLLEDTTILVKIPSNEYVVTSCSRPIDPTDDQQLVQKFPTLFQEPSQAFPGQPGYQPDNPLLGPVPDDNQEPDQERTGLNPEYQARRRQVYENACFEDCNYVRLTRGKTIDGQVINFAHGQNLYQYFEQCSCSGGDRPCNHGNAGGPWANTQCKTKYSWYAVLANVGNQAVWVYAKLASGCCCHATRTTELSEYYQK